MGDEVDAERFQFLRQAAGLIEAGETRSSTGRVKRLDEIRAGVPAAAVSKDVRAYSRQTGEQIEAAQKAAGVKTAAPTPAPEQKPAESPEERMERLKAEQDEASLDAMGARFAEFSAPKAVARPKVDPSKAKALVDRIRSNNFRKGDS